MTSAHGSGRSLGDPHPVRARRWRCINYITCRALANILIDIRAGLDADALQASYGRSPDDGNE